MHVLSVSASPVCTGIPFQSLDAVQSALQTFAMGDYRESVSQHMINRDAQARAVADVMQSARYTLIDVRGSQWERRMAPQGAGRDQTVRIRSLTAWPEDARPGDYALEIIHGRDDRSAEADLALHLKTSRLLGYELVQAQLDKAAGPEDRVRIQSIARRYLGLLGLDTDLVRLDIAPAYHGRPAPEEFVNTSDVSAQLYIAIAPLSDPFFIDPKQATMAERMAMTLCTATGSLIW